MEKVTAKSYRTLFIVALVLVLLMFGTSIFYYVQFRQIEDDDADKHTILMTKNSALLMSIIAAFGIMVLIVLFFGLPRWEK